MLAWQIFFLLIEKGNLRRVANPFFPLNVASCVWRDWENE
jgi:hypothetical protein